jgi:hypothetical protein
MGLLKSRKRLFWDRLWWNQTGMAAPLREPGAEFLSRGRQGGRFGF